MNGRQCMRRRRGRGEGGITRRSDGLWVGSVSFGYGANGKRKRRYVYGKTKETVLKKLRTAAPELGESEKLTVAQYLARWLETIKPTVEPNTHRPYERHVRLHIAPHLGHVKLAKLRPTDVEGLYVALRNAGVSAA